MVPLTVGEQLVGFVQVLANLTVLRYSSFQRQPYACRLSRRVAMAKEFAFHQRQGRFFKDKSGSSRPL